MKNCNGMMMQFSEFNGNHRTINGITAMLQAGRVPQTMILEGPAGSGKKNLAFLIAAGILCNHPLPCGNCNSCRKVLVTGHPDVSEIVPPKDKAYIVVDQIRAVRSDAFVRPVEAGCKVFVINGPMNDAAQNAFLKVLEEPPPGVYFILICEHRNLLMDTVLSRGIVFSLDLASATETRSDQEQATQVVNQMANALATGSRADLLKAVAKAGENRTLHASVLDGFYTMLHHALLMANGASVQECPYKECAPLLSRRFTKERLAQMAEIVTLARKKIMYNVNGNLFFTALCSELLPRK